MALQNIGRGPRLRAGRAAALSAMLGASSCTVTQGVLELNWVFVDRDGDAIYPGDLFATQAFQDSCHLRGVSGGVEVRYDLRLELMVCDPTCAEQSSEGCSDPQCQVIDPVTFPCDTARWSNPDVPASDDPYEFRVQPVIQPADGPACRTIAPACIAVPGPRQRHIEPGKLTDLQVYQIVVDIDASSGRNSEGATLDLEACGCA